MNHAMIHVLGRFKGANLQKHDHVALTIAEINGVPNDVDAIVTALQGAWTVERTDEERGEVVFCRQVSAEASEEAVEAALAAI